MTAIVRNCFWVIALIFVFSACRKDDVTVNKEIIPPIPEVVVDASLFGQVVDESGEALEGVEILVGNYTFTTDINGVFKFDNIRMNENGTYIKAEKEGYFLGAKFVEPRAGNVSHTKIIMLEKRSIAIFQATSGSNLTGTGGFSLTFPQNAIQEENGNSYASEVNVFARNLSPAEAPFIEKMPGDLRAIDENNNQFQLVPYGMLAVELEAPSGVALNVIEGESVSIEMPIPAELLTDAPSTIPLWHFDESTGYWKKEGQATLAGDKYIGAVSHFSFWCWALPFPVVQLSGNIVDQNNEPIVGYVHLLANSNDIIPSYAFTYTDNNGFFSGKVPMDVSMNLIISTDNCAIDYYNETIGPFSDDAVLPTIALTFTDYTFPLSGRLINCEGEVVSNGYAIFRIIGNEGEYSVLRYANTEGELNYNYRNCLDATEILVTGYDLDEFNASPQITYDVNGLNELNVGDIQMCDDNISEYINYTIDGNNFTLPDALPIARIDNGIFIDSWLDSNAVQIQLQNVTGPGVYQPNVMYVYGKMGVGDYIFTSCSGMACENIEVTITTVGGIGEVIEGSFSGQLPEHLASSPMYDVQGEFRVIIEE